MICPSNPDRHSAKTTPCSMQMLPQVLSVIHYTIMLRRLDEVCSLISKLSSSWSTAAENRREDLDCRLGPRLLLPSADPCFPCFGDELVNSYRSTPSDPGMFSELWSFDVSSSLLSSSSVDGDRLDSSVDLDVASSSRETFPSGLEGSFSCVISPEAAAPTDVSASCFLLERSR